MCIVEQFVDNLFSYLISNTDNKHYSGIIKRHNDKFEQFGEFSFPWRVTAWRKFITWPPEWDNSTDLSIFDVTFRANTVSLEDACNKIKEKSKELPLLIKECKIVKDRVHIFLDRTFLIKQCFINGAVNLEPHNVNREKKLYFTIDKGIEDDISHYRLELVSKAAKNMAINDGYCVTEKFIEGETIKIHFTCKSSNKSNNAFNVVCAPVLNSKSGSKEKQISSAEYLEKRTLDMKLKAQHKYRIHVTDEDLWAESVRQLGEACAIFDLLQIKPTHSVQISMLDGGTGCSKGASFVLYNYARLSRIINTFQQNVSNKLYPELPNVAEVDFALLDDEDEWFIVFNYIVFYDSTLKNCVDFGSDEPRVAPHQLCSFLSTLVVKFSVYYRKVKVLLTPREHLIPKVFARIHLLMLLHKILSHGLSLLSIEPLSEM